MLRASGFFYAQLAAPRHGITTPIQRLRNWQVTFLFTAFLHSEAARQTLQAIPNPEVGSAVQIGVKRQGLSIRRPDGIPGASFRLRQILRLPGSGVGDPNIRGRPGHGYTRPSKPPIPGIV